MLLLAVNHYLHSRIMQRVRLAKIHDVKLHPQSLCCIRDFEEEPLGVAVRINIILQEQVVLIFALLVRDAQIPTLKAGLEEERPVIIVFKLVFNTMGFLLSRVPF